MALVTIEVALPHPAVYQVGMGATPDCLSCAGGRDGWRAGGPRHVCAELLARRRRCHPFGPLPPARLQPVVTPLWQLSVGTAGALMAALLYGRQRRGNVLKGT